MAKPNLRVVKKTPPAPVTDNRYDHEWQHRQRVNRTDWAKVHVDGDKPSRTINFVPPGWRRWWRAL